MLNIRDALKLYSLLSNFVPEENSDVLDYIGTTLRNIKNSDNPEAFGRAIMLMSGMELSELSNKTPVETIELFTQGLIDNKFNSLVALCKGISDG